MVSARKGLAAFTYLDQSNSSSAFVEIGNVLTLLVYEDNSGRHSCPVLRFATYNANRIDDGVCWGGAKNCRLFKDLSLAPQRRARGQRMDRSKGDLLSLALRLDRRLSRAARHPAAPWPKLKLPRLWAGFRPSMASRLSGKGPEFDAECNSRSTNCDEMFRESARNAHGLVLYPLDWVGHEFNRIIAVFAELTPSIRRQICRIGELPDGLIGYQGAANFDFFNSHFRDRRGRRHRHTVSNTKNNH
jgi:hypothetical protein